MFIFFKRLPYTLDFKNYLHLPNLAGFSLRQIQTISKTVTVFPFKGKLTHEGTSILMAQCPPLIKHFLTATIQSLGIWQTICPQKQSGRADVTIRKTGYGK